MNSVINRVEVIEGAGTVKVSTSNRYLGESLSAYEDVRIGEYAVLSVLDDGSGIFQNSLRESLKPFP